MPTLKYPLKRGGLKQLEIKYSLGLRNTRVLVNGKEIGTIENRKALKEGRDLKLPDGAILTITLSKNLFLDQWNVMRNGTPLPGSAFDPEVRSKSASVVLFYMAAANLFFGLGTLFFNLDFSISISNPWFVVIIGLLNLVLGFAARDGSKTAVKIGLLILMIDSVLMFIAILLGSFPFNVGVVFVRSYLLFTLIQGLRAMDRIEDGTEQPQQPVYDERQPARGPSARPAQPQPAAQKQMLTKAERRVLQGVAIAAVAVVAIAYVVTSGLPKPAQSEVTTASIQTPQPTGPVPTPYILYPQDFSPVVLNILPATPHPSVSLPMSPSEPSRFKGDLAWNKPTFASTSYGGGHYPYLPTSGGGSWQSMSSEGTWFYVDLGQPEYVHQLIVNYAVDLQQNTSAETYFIVSGDLIHWDVLADEIVASGAFEHYKTHVITLPEAVRKQYVGVYAQNWSGQWGAITTFAVIPTGYNYTTEEVQAAVS